MSSRDVDDFLAEADDVIDDWEGSHDSATWTADGSHEHNTDGRYYGEDQWDTSHGLFQFLPPRFDTISVAPVGTPLTASRTLPGWRDLTPHASQVRIEPDLDAIHAMHERTEQVWANLRAAFAPVVEWVRRNIGQDECALAPPVDVEIREDTLRDLVPLDLTRYVDQPPPPPFGPFRHEEPTGRQAQRSTYGGPR